MKGGRATAVNCWHCGKRLRLRLDGNLPKHRTLVRPKKQDCPASGYASNPDATREPESISARNERRSDDHERLYTRADGKVPGVDR